MAMGTSSQTASTDWGYMEKMMAITRPKMAITIHSSRNTIRKKKNLVRLLTYLAVYSEMDLPWLRMEMIRAPKSCTAPITILPTKIHSIAGSQPQMMAIAGPTIGPVPAIDVK